MPLTFFDEPNNLGRSCPPAAAFLGGVLSADSGGGFDWPDELSHRCDWS